MLEAADKEERQQQQDVDDKPTPRVIP
eukprot:SAG11_NODE_27149_length_336_cov_0.843882_2_plen_26_part_01